MGYKRLAKGALRNFKPSVFIKKDCSNYRKPGTPVYEGDVDRDKCGSFKPKNYSEDGFFKPKDYSENLGLACLHCKYYPED